MPSEFRKVEMKPIEIDGEDGFKLLEDKINFLLEKYPTVKTNIGNLCKTDMTFSNSLGEIFEYLAFIDKYSLMDSKQKKSLRYTVVLSYNEEKDVIETNTVICESYRKQIESLNRILYSEEDKRKIFVNGENSLEFIQNLVKSSNIKSKNLDQYLLFVKYLINKNYKPICFLYGEDNVQTNLLDMGCYYFVHKKGEYAVYLNANGFLKDCYFEKDITNDEYSNLIMNTENLFINNLDECIKRKDFLEYVWMPLLKYRVERKLNTFISSKYSFKKTVSLITFSQYLSQNLIDFSDKNIKEFFFKVNIFTI